MKRTFLFLVLVTCFSFFSCSIDDDDASDMRCKTCDDFTSSGATLEVCDNGNDTATITLFLSGIDIFNDIIEIENSDDFSKLDCSYFEKEIDDLDF